MTGDLVLPRISISHIAVRASFSLCFFMPFLVNDFRGGTPAGHISWTTPPAIVLEKGAFAAANLGFLRVSAVRF
jgi:hypothetical protein